MQKIQNKFLALESLRGVAALSVALLHFNIGSHFNNGFTNNAWLMVDFFFVLSGFVIALNYLNRITTLSSLVKFQKKRFLRLYPLHFSMLIVFLGLEVLKKIVEINSDIVSNTPAFSENNLIAFIGNMLLIHNLVFSDLTFNSPSWSISAEFFTYLLFALLVYFSRGSKILICSILVLFVVSCGYLLNIFGIWNTDNISGPLRCIYSFSIGSLIFLFYDSCKDKVMLNSSIPSMLFLVLSVALVIFIGVEGNSAVFGLPLFFGATILLIVLTDSNQSINKLLSHKCLVYLGTISYGIYMIHMMVWWIINLFLRFIVQLPVTKTESDGFNITIENIFYADLITMAGIAIILILSHMSYKYIEMPFNKIRQKY